MAKSEFMIAESTQIVAEVNTCQFGPEDSTCIDEEPRIGEVTHIFSIGPETALDDPPCVPLVLRLMSTPNLAQLKQALAISEKIEALQAELASVVGGGSTVASIVEAVSTSVAKAGKRTMSAATKAKMRAAQQARWAVKRGESVVASVVTTEKKLVKKAKGTMSADGRARIVAAQKARWAKIKGAVMDTAEAAVALVTPKAKKKAKRTISPEARAKMAAAAKKRWADVKKAAK